MSHVRGLTFVSGEALLPGGVLAEALALDLTQLLVDSLTDLGPDTQYLTITTDYIPRMVAPRTWCPRWWRTPPCTGRTWQPPPASQERRQLGRRCCWRPRRGLQSRERPGAINPALSSSSLVIDVRCKYDGNHDTPPSFYIKQRETQDCKIYALDQNKWLLAVWHHFHN